MADSEGVELGFVEKPVHPLRITSPFFPSKVGGKPAWLNLRDLLDPELMLCKLCGKPLVFLLQVYAPDTESDDCFHRTLFIFCCKDGRCVSTQSSDCFLVLRNQLRRDNQFYSNDPPPDVDADTDNKCLDENFTKPKVWSSLCDLCGCRGGKKCSRCHAASYCSRMHQTVDWKTGHREVCGKLEESHVQEPDTLNSPSSFLFPEYEIVMEPEPDESDAERSEEECMEDYNKFVKTQGSDVDTDSKTDNELEALAAAGKEAIMADKQFRKFQKRIARQSQQILRYDNGGDPLWVSDACTPKSEDIPPCQCGAERTFEFQVMPQLLNHLGIDSLEESVDWGTLAIYTCSQNCGDGNTYHSEFLWKQEFSDTGLPGKVLSF